MAELPKDPLLYDENIILGPGFVLVNEGDRVVRHNLDLTHEQRREMLQPIVDRLPEAEAEIAQEVEDLSAILTERNPLSLIASMWLANAITDPDSYAEHSHQGNDAFTEYVATLALTQPFDRGEHEGLAPHTPEQLSELQDRVKALFASMMALHGAKSIDLDDDDAQSPLAWLRFKTLVAQTATRYSAYPIHLDRMLRGVLEPLDEMLLGVFGFSGTDAMALCAAVEAVTERKLNEHLGRVDHARRDLLANVEAYETDGTVAPPYEEAFYQAGAALAPEARVEPAMRMLLPWAYTFIGDGLVFTAAELAAEASTEEAEVSLERAQAFARRMSIGFGGVDPRHFTRPSATPPLHLRPLVRLEPDQHRVEDYEGLAYFCPVPQSVFWALRANIESGLNPEGPRELRPLRIPEATEAMWERYEGSRSSYAERRAMDLFEGQLRGGQAERNLTYHAHDRTGTIGETELDGLVYYDGVLLLIEVKAGVLSPPARRGAADSLQEELRDRLVGEGHWQAIRAKRFAEAGGRFWRADGTEVEFPGDVRRVELVVVTLEDLATFTTDLHEMAAAGLLADTAGPDDTPWCVSLSDLEVVDELISSPTEFLHYLRFRIGVAEEGRVGAGDEIDWIGYYLTVGTSFDEAADGDPDAGIKLMGYGEPIDAYFMHTYGRLRAPAPKPEQPLPSPLREMRDEFETRTLPGRVELAAALYDIPFEDREPIAERFQRNLKVAEAEQRPSGASFLVPGTDLGLTHLMLAPETPEAEAITQVGGTVTIRKHRSERDRWLGIGTRRGAEAWVDTIVYNSHPWVPNPTLDEALDDGKP